MKRRELGIALTGAAALALGGGVTRPARAADATVTIRFAHTIPNGDPIDLGSIRFKELVEQRSNGTVKVAIFPFNQLGGENQLLQQVKQGSDPDRRYRRRDDRATWCPTSACWTRRISGRTGSPDYFYTILLVLLI